MRLTQSVRRAGAAALFSIFAVAGVAAADAQDAHGYPNRPIRMLVPNAPGSSVDTLGRIFAQALTNVSGQQVV
ncbi:MAG: tripartite tricarboxylate transporter substrate binding protein, partial [Burkholderiales bacterium]